MDMPQEDYPMNDPVRQEREGENENEEGEGDTLMPGPGGLSDDSSEEEEDDEEEEKRIREGFIVDEDEDEDEEEPEEERRKRRKKRKRHHRREEDDLEEDDLELLAENTGGTFKKRGLTRLRRGRDSESPPAASSSRRRPTIESSEDDLDDDDDLPRVQDIQNIWDDERVDDEEDLADFIESDEEEDVGGVVDEKAREERRRKKRKEAQEQRRHARIAHPELAGIDANAWDEIHDVFGDGHEYDWALEGDDEVQFDEEQSKAEMRYQDVFEPSEIRDRHLTEDDDLIRAKDTPERMQLLYSTLSKTTTLNTRGSLDQGELPSAAMWITQRLSARKNRDFFTPGGPYEDLKTALIEAVSSTVKFLFIDELEAPFIWAHRRDHISYFNPEDSRPRIELLTQAELWRIYTLGQKYISLAERRRAILTSYERLGITDRYFEEDIFPNVDSAETVADASDWLSMKYKDKRSTENEFRALDEEEGADSARKPKMPSRISAYELAKKTVVAKLATAFGIQPHEVVLNFNAQSTIFFLEDQELNPIAYAEQFSDPDPAKAQTPESLLERARLILATEIGRDPLLKSHMRQLFREEATVSCEPTEKGLVVIDDENRYYTFKYLHRKKLSDMLDNAMFLHIREAEAANLVKVTISLDPEIQDLVERRLMDAFSSDGFSEAAQAWNEERKKVIRDALDKHLFPSAARWVGEYVQEEASEFMASQLGDLLRRRINMAPLNPGNMSHGEAPRVLAMSWGHGHPKKDVIHIVMVDELGRLRDQTTLDNLVDDIHRDEFTDLLDRRHPDVIVMGGFSMTTTKLSQRVKEIINLGRDKNVPQIPVVLVPDDLARMYQHTEKQWDTLEAMAPLHKYCLALARYAISPVNEFAAMSSDISEVRLQENDVDVNLIPVEKRLVAYERALMDVVNKIGVDINRAVTDEYYRTMLPFICGLGPRKARALIEKVNATGGALMNRAQIVTIKAMTSKIFVNAAAFLRIPQDPKSNNALSRADDENAQDPLDDTRIHPEDYEYARKMASDALDLDEEDIRDVHASLVVSDIMNDPDKERKLSELNLDDFAVSLYERDDRKKRHTLNVVKEEILSPFAEQREPFVPPDGWQILGMLCGENRKTLRKGLIITVQALRMPKGGAILVQLGSGLDGVVLPSEDGEDTSKVNKGNALAAAITGVGMDPDTDHYIVELTTSRRALDDGDWKLHRVERDPHWNQNLQDRDNDLLERKKRAEANKTRRIIKHPNFQNFNTLQAEAYLENQPIGDVVVRPSSKGVDHLAVTWKVDEGLYQHIDVRETNLDRNGQSTGGMFVVDQHHSYADLDELIVNHVQAMARKVEELMNHDRFKRGSEDELHIFLKNYVAANPAKSMYGFTLNRKKPGHFNLCFLANSKSTVQTWPVRVAPEAYYLFDAAAIGVNELCDAFKVRHLHQSQSAAAQAAGGKTPRPGYGAGGRTPARTGATTPGHSSVRQPARTPNPYGAAPPARTPNPYSGSMTPRPPPPPSSYAAAPTPAWGAGPTPAYSTPGWGAPPNGFAPTPAMPPPGQFGYQTPNVPQGMNPERAAMIQNSGGWGGQGGGAGWGAS